MTKAYILVFHQAFVEPKHIDALVEKIRVTTGCHVFTIAHVNNNEKVLDLIRVEKTENA